ncbi:glycine-rich cell wall structural protein-like [Phragmites australis]|uniref:glycine-rich cell wall structural protein-like n=1 Tax=Phragmites australis TaxID=29695 RepID=UPI002D765083|nr:glycine-rich cell wall structural protein-like [Phragmites australis]
MATAAPRLAAPLLLLLGLLSVSALAARVDAGFKSSPGKKKPVVKPPPVAPGTGTANKPGPGAGGGGAIPTIPGFNIPGTGGSGFGNGIPGLGCGWGGGYGGPGGGYSRGGVVAPTVVCSDKGPCYRKRVTCPMKCFSSYSGAGKGYGGGGGGSCTIDCKVKCTAYC